VMDLTVGDHMGSKKHSQAPERGPRCQQYLWEHSWPLKGRAGRFPPPHSCFPHSQPVHQGSCHSSPILLRDVGAAKSLDRS
jgi:hypothetical protein